MMLWITVTQTKESMDRIIIVGLRLLHVFELHIYIFHHPSISYTSLIDEVVEEIIVKYLR